MAGRMVKRPIGQLAILLFDDSREGKAQSCALGYKRHAGKMHGGFELEALCCLARSYSWRPFLFYRDHASHTLAIILEGINRPFGGRREIELVITAGCAV